MSRVARIAALAAICGSVACTCAQALQRSVVASFGNDANSCTITAPCRSFTRALAVTDDRGEIVALDAAGYGAVAITKSVTITSNPGFYAGITAAAGDAVTISSPGITVVLRGLNINGLGTAHNGVTITSAFQVTIDNCVIANFNGDGVFVNGAARVRITDTAVRFNDFRGILAQGGANLTVVRVRVEGNDGYGVGALGDVDATTTIVTVADSMASYNGAGFGAQTSTGTGVALMTVSGSTATDNDTGYRVSQTSGTASISVTHSVASGNSFGFQQAASGTFRSLGNNTAENNRTGDTSGTITTVPGV